MVPKASFDEAQSLIANRDALVVDVRDAPELAATGKVKNALHVSRGMLEFRACPSTAYHEPAFRTDRPILLYCASGGRSALASKTLRDMGFKEVYNLGAFKDWVAAGGETDGPMDQGMTGA